MTNMISESRRKFCKISLLASLGLLLSPRSLRGATPSARLRGACRVEVVRCNCFTDLQGCFLADPESGPCGRFRVGDSFTVTPANLEAMRRGGCRCQQAWRTIEPYVMAALDAPATEECAPALKETQAVISCPDGTRPVIFKITAC